MPMQTLTIKVRNKKAYSLLKNLEEAKLIEVVNEPIGIYEARKIIRKAEKSKSIPLLDARAISETWKNSR